MVLSDIPPYSDCVKNYKTGYLAKGTSQWVKYLSWLIESPENERKSGSSQKRGIGELSHRKQLPKYETLFEMLSEKNITVYTSVIGDKDHLMEDQNTKGANFVAFTDLQSEMWEVRRAL